MMPVQVSACNLVTLVKGVKLSGCYTALTEAPLKVAVTPATCHVPDMVHRCSCQTLGRLTQRQTRVHAARRHGIRRQQRLSLKRQDAKPPTQSNRVQQHDTSTDNTRMSYTRAIAPGLHLGPVQLMAVPGKGRGLVATLDLEPGQLLLVCAPAALLTGLPGQSLQPVDLEEHILAQRHPETLQTLGTLHGGSDAWSEVLPDLASLLPGQGSNVSSRTRASQPVAAVVDNQNCQVASGVGATIAGCSSMNSQAAAASLQLDSAALSVVDDCMDTVSPHAVSNEHDTNISIDYTAPYSSVATKQHGTCGYQRHIGDEQLRRAVQLNCYGEPWGDVAATSCRGEPFCSYLGVWPAFAMINHSCSPNACTLVLGGKMVVRAARRIPCGEEITISYLGGLSSSPLSIRKLHLKDTYGFDCTCRRCTLEGDALQRGCGDFTSTYSKLEQQVKASVLQALEREDMSRLKNLQHLLLKTCLSIEAELCSLADRETYTYLKCSVYLCYELLGMCLDATSKPGTLNTDTHAIRVQLMQCFAPGSYGLAEITATYLTRVNAAMGPTHAKSQQALQWCLDAHTARYGPVSPQVLAKLLDAHSGDALADALAEAELAE